MLSYAANRKSWLIDFHRVPCSSMPPSAWMNMFSTDSYTDRHAGTTKVSNIWQQHLVWKDRCKYWRIRIYYLFLHWLTRWYNKNPTFGIKTQTHILDKQLAITFGVKKQTQISKIVSTYSYIDCPTQSRLTEALEPHGMRVGRWRAPKIFSTYSYIDSWTKKFATYFVDNIWHKKSVYVRSGTSMNKAISKWWDRINSTVQRFPQWRKIRKISTRKPTTRMVCYIFLRANTQK